MSEMQPQFGKPVKPGSPKRDVDPDYTISADFDGSGNVTLNLGGLGDVTGDSGVEIYAAEGTPPTSRQSGATNRRLSVTNPTGRLPSCNGGTDDGAQSYWVQAQLTRGGTTNTYTGSVNQTTFPASNVGINLFVT